MSTLSHWTLMPGAEIVEFDDGTTTRRIQFGVPPCLKLWQQKRLPPPTEFVLPDEFFRHGVVQACLEFFVYNFLFVLGKAFGKLPNQKLIVYGTPNQIARARRMLEVTLLGFSQAEMDFWSINDQQAARLDRQRRMTAWFAAKHPDFAAIPKFLESLKDEAISVPSGGSTGHIQRFKLEELITAARLQGGSDLFIEFLDACMRYVGGIDQQTPITLKELALFAYEFGSLELDDFIEWVSYSVSGRIDLTPEYIINRQGNNQFEVVGYTYFDEKSLTKSVKTINIDLNFADDQAPYLITLPPQTAPVTPAPLKVLCLGSDSGFEAEHPTTGFAFFVSGHLALVDTPVGTSWLLEQHGIDPNDVRVILETHGHEDHMGSAIHFLLDRITNGTSYTYVASDSAIRTCVAKIAACLDISENEALALLEHGDRHPFTTGNQHQTGRVVRIVPGEPIRLLGATWQFVQMVHPIYTTGFRLAYEYHGQKTVIAFTSDTAPLSGAFGTDAMKQAGFLTDEEDPLTELIKGDETLIFWEAGGAHGDPIHYKPQDETLARKRYPVGGQIIYMHTHPLPIEFRKTNTPLARPGMVWTVIDQPLMDPNSLLAIQAALKGFKLRTGRYWLREFLVKGSLLQLGPQTAIVHEGESGDDWYILVRGTAEVIVHDEVIAKLDSGAFFGELAILANGQRRATIQTAGPAILLRIPGQTFRDFVLANELTSEDFERFWQDVRLIAKTRLFVGFPHHVIAKLARSAQRLHYPAGCMLIQQGEAGRELYVIESGEVEIERTLPDGNIFTCIIKGAGEIVGEYGVFVPGVRRTATVRAKTDISVLALTDTMISQVITGQLPLNLRLLALLRDRQIPVPSLSAVTLP